MLASKAATARRRADANLRASKAATASRKTGVNVPASETVTASKSEAATSKRPDVNVTAILHDNAAPTRVDTNITAIVHGNTAPTRSDANVTAIANNNAAPKRTDASKTTSDTRKSVCQRSGNGEQCQPSCNCQQDVADRRADANITVSVGTYDARTRANAAARDPVTSDTRKTDAYVMAFAYAAAAIGKQGYQGQEVEQRSINCYMDEK